MIQLYARMEDLTPTEGKEVDPVASPEDCADPSEFGMTHYTDWLEDIRTNGIKYALKVHPNGLIADGNFRYWCAVDLGMEYVPIDLFWFMGMTVNDYLMSIRSDIPIPRAFTKTPVVQQKHIGVPLGHGYHKYCGIDNLRQVLLK